MKKILAFAAFLLAMMPLAAQETYENAKIAQEDLNGTARYVGMGGAMEALGADISTMSTNPAGIGLFRKSNASVSFGVVSQDDVENTMRGNKTNASFDQIGFVWSTRTGKTSFLNFGFNFHKSRNFDMILSAADALDHASINKQTYIKAKKDLLYKSVNYVPDFDKPYYTCNQLDDILAPNMNYIDGVWGYEDANAYRFDRAHKGYVGVYDFNISGNINNRLYLGLTVGLHDVHYRHYGEYTETIPDNYETPTNNYMLTVADKREITGTGVDIKAGVIFRPVEESPFRIGAYLSTPTFYELRTSNYTYITDGVNTHDSHEIMDASPRTSYKFKLYTPWKFGLSLGHTVDNYLALGATYEYADYSAMDTRIITGEYYDEWSGSYSNDSQSDKVMNSHTEKTLKGVHTLKLGAEYKPAKDVALRIGYNYVSSMYDKNGFKDGTLDTHGSYISSATDYTNWEDTHRLTLGAGYTYEKFNFSLAYQYSATNGTFYPFGEIRDSQDATLYNKADGVKVTNKRHQLLLTLGYTF